MRKVAKHSNNIQIRVTTTDSWFNVNLNALYAKFSTHNQDPNILSEDGDVIEYMHGFLMDANTPWTNVDYVLFPVHMSVPEHWFLLVFDVHRRRLVVYNSLQPTRSFMRTNISDACEAYIFLLPILLTRCGFWKSRTDINFLGEHYSQKGENDLIELEFAEGVPEQVEG